MAAFRSEIRNAVFCSGEIRGIRMAIKRNSGKNGRSGRSSDARNGEGRGRRRLLFLLLLALTLGLAGGVLWLALQIPGALMTRNPRFRLRRVEIKSSGYWHGRERALIERLGLDVERGEDNLFSLSVRDIRRRLLSIQNIENCEVRLILPDTLFCSITERVPRAVLFSAGGNAVVDEKGCQFLRSESSAAQRRLPVIHGFRRGAAIREQALPALNLLMTTINDYPDVVVERLSVAVPGEITAELVYREHERCIAVFPVREDYHFLLNTLQSSILRAGASGVAGRRFDLRYRGRVVLTE